MGTPEHARALVKVLSANTTLDLTASSYLRSMTHTATVNIGLFFGITGRVITTTSACTSGSQGLGYAYEPINKGGRGIMVAGGGGGFWVLQVGKCKTKFATRPRN